uniref:Uncharacterized protein n=1 Tax=Caenorhabditis japonica TaxID=281687 RepID=A0A8R1IHW3_CAEJA
MGQNATKVSQLPPPQPQLAAAASPGFARAQTMLDVSQAQLTAVDGVPGLQRSNSDGALNTSGQVGQKSYQRALEWGRNEHFFKLAHTFHTNNY